MEITRHSSGVAKAGLATGIVGAVTGPLALLGAGANGIGSLLGGGNRTAGVGTAQALLDGMLVNALMGGNAWNGGRSCGSCGPCESDHFMTRFDSEKDLEIASLKSQIALRDANTYSDQKALEMYKYVDGRMRAIEGQIAQQAVINESIAGQMKVAKAESDCCCQSLKQAIQAEKEARCCGDNQIVNYANATFYPQMISDLTIGTTAKAQETWNPISNCGCGCPNP